jgi:hypothetical protein
MWGMEIPIEQLGRLWMLDCREMKKQELCYIAGPDKLLSTEHAQYKKTPSTVHSMVVARAEDKVGKLSGT